MKIFTKLITALCAMAVLPWAAFANENWEPPVTLSTNFANTGNLAVDADGNTYALWIESGVPIYSLKPFGGVWSAATQIPGSPGVSNPNTASLAVDPNGNAVAVWANPISASTLPFGGAWTAPVQVDTLNDSFNPEVVVDDAGNAVVLWINSVNTLFSSSLPFGGAWTAPVQVTPIGNVDFYYKILISPTGDTVAIWDDTSNGINASFLVAGVWTAPVTFTPPTSNFAFDAAIDEFGTVTITYAIVDSMNPSNVYIYSNQLPYLGVWAAPIALTGSVDGSFVETHVVIDSNNNATAVWTSNSLAFFATRPFAGAWTAPVQFTTQTTRNISLDVNPSNGNVIAGFAYFDGGSFNISSSELTFGGGWTAPTNITSTGGDDLAPIIVIDGSDNANILWLGATGKGGGGGVFAAQTGLECPNITGIDPEFGPIEGGTVVTIAGINFTGATQVFFGTTPAASFIVDSDIQITATSPAHIAGPVFVTVVGPDCTSPETEEGIFTFIGDGDVPLPPASFTGVRGADRFLTQTDYFNYLTWTASPDPTVVSYHLYRNGDSLAFISATSLFVYIDHNRSKYGTDTYQLTAVNGIGVESTPLVVVLP